MIEQSSDLIFTTDAAGMLTLINPAWEEYTGYASADALGQPALMLLHAEDRSTILEHFQAFQNGARTPVRLEYRYRRRDGHTGWADVQLRALHDHRGRFEGMLCIASEITARKETQERLQLLESVVVNANDAVVITEAEPIDEPGPRILYVNEAFTRMSGHTLEEVRGHSPRMLQGEGSDPAVKARIRKALQAWKPIRVELLNYRKNGTPFWVEMSIVPIANEKGWYTHWVSVQRDITERRQVEEKVQRQTQQQAVLADLAYYAIADRDLHSILQRAAEQVAAALDVEITTVTELQGARQDLVIRAGHGWPAGTVGTTVPGASLPGYAIEVGEAVVVPDMRTETRFDVGDLPTAHGVQCGASVVIHGLDAPYGALCVKSTRHRSFNAEDLQFLQAVANVLGTAVEHQRAAAQLKESEARYRALVTNMPGAVYRCILDEAWTMHYVNDGIRDITGYPAADFVLNARRTLGSLIHPDDSPQVMAAVQEAVERQEPFELEYRIQHADGTERWLYEQGRAASEGVIEGVMMDITSRKTAERGLIEAREDAERANLAKSMFLSRVSHELRTPLNAILGFGQLIDRNPTHPEKVERHNRQILTAGRHLLDLVNDVMDVARIDSGEMSLQLTRLCLKDAVEECVAVVMPQAARGELTLSVDVEGLAGTLVSADGKRLRQVLFNLLGNAVKYTEPGGQIGVLCWITPEGQARVEVSDTGPGMTRDEQARLFQPFVRLEGKQSEKEGTGLGLSLCKRVVELMKGQIGVRSDPGQGSTFWFEFPLVPGNNESVADGPGSAAQGVSA